VSDIPLLFEARLADTVDRIVLVHASDAVRLQRLVTLRGLTADAAHAMIAAQLPSAAKRALSHWIIDNDGTRAALDAQIGHVWQAIETAAEHARRARVTF
jgi:dephospho-CoA kinase